VKSTQNSQTLKKDAAHAKKGSMKKVVKSKVHGGPEVAVVA